MDKQNSPNILQNAPFPYTYQKIIIDDIGDPVDSEFIDVNEKFAVLTDLQMDEIINKKSAELLPDFWGDELDQLSIFAEVAINNKQREFEYYSDILDNCFRVEVYSPQKYHFVTIFK